MIRNYLCRTTPQEFNPPVLGMARLRDYPELVPVTIQKITSRFTYITLDSTGAGRMVSNGIKEWVKGIESTNIDKYCAYIHDHSLHEDVSASVVVENVLKVVNKEKGAVVSWGVLHTFDNGIGLTKHLKSDILRSVLTFAGTWTHEDVKCLGDGLEQQVYIELEKARNNLRESFKTQIKIY